MRLNALRKEIAAVFHHPSVRQKEAYARFAHTLAAASVIGAITLAFAEGSATWAWFWKTYGLAVIGVTLFVAGAVLLKGE